MTKLLVAMVLSLVLVAAPCGRPALAQNQPSTPMLPPVTAPNYVPPPGTVAAEAEMANFGFHYTLNVVLASAIVGYLSSHISGSTVGTLVGAVAGAAIGSAWFFSQYARFYFHGGSRSDYRG
ncbi:MAG: hypothetical protein GC191_00650 [Azospirillum sp.]|nr:hypothetical protein [Azospirillum sp.]